MTHVDLTKITTPFGLLDKQTQEALKSYVGGIEFYGVDGWLAIKDVFTDVFFVPHLVYRAKPKPVTKPNINWDHVHTDYKWMATDKSGETHLFIDEPEPYDDTWTAYERSALADSHLSFEPGNCDWKDSLVCR